MVRQSVKSISYSSGSRKVARSRQLVNKAAALLRARASATPRAPLRTGGFYGLYTGRGREELKVIDVQSGGNVATGTGGGSVILINGVAQGTDYTNRIGRKVMLKSCLLRMNIVPNIANSSPQGDVVRVMIVYDCQTNAAAPVLSDILLNPTVTYQSPMNLNNRDRFKILADKFYIMNANVYTAGALTAGSPRPVQIKIFKKMYMEEVFGGVGNTVGSIQTGALWLVIVGANTAFSTFAYETRVRFVDA